VHRSALMILASLGLLSGVFASYVFIRSLRSPDLMTLAVETSCWWVVLAGLALAVVAVAVVAAVTRPRP
jgi:hypothetical protein